MIRSTPPSCFHFLSSRSVFWRKIRISTLSVKGYFSDVDPNVEVRSLSKKRDFDVKKRESFSDFIWNTDWQSHMDAEQDNEKTQNEEPMEEENGQGFLSLARAADLNNVYLDLSDQLKPNPKSEALNEPVEKETVSKFIPSTNRETAQWERSTKFATNVIAMNLTEDEKTSAKQNMDTYNQENTELFLWNLSLIGICFTMTYVSYSQDVALSYLSGAFGGLVYLRLLKKGLEGIAGGGGISSLAAQPRFLIPVVLVMASNRWNALAADEYGIHVELLPMLVGFFTYKAAVIGRQSIVVFKNFVKDFKRM